MRVEGVGVGVDGGVFVGGLGAEIGVEEGDACREGVVGVAGLMEETPGGGDEKSREDKTGKREEGGGKRGQVLREGQGGEEGEDEAKEGGEAPGKLEEGEFGKVVPEGKGERGEEERDGNGEEGQGQDRRGGGWARSKFLALLGMTRVWGAEGKGDQGCCDGGEEEEGDDGSGADDGVVEAVVGGVAGHVVEQEVIGGAHAFDDDHLDLDEAALVCGGQDIESGEREAEGGSGGGGEGEADAG